MTPPDFQSLMPAFKDVPVPDVQRWLDRADPYFNVGRWGLLYSDGLANWVAHKLEMEGTAANLPVIPIIRNIATNKRVGSEQIAYSEAALAAVMSEPMNATSFGREYLTLRDQVGMGAIATGGPAFGRVGIPWGDGW